MVDAETQVEVEEGTGARPVAEEERVHGCAVSRSRGQMVLHPERARWVEVIRALRDEDGYGMCVDLTAVDYLVNPYRRLPDGVTAERFEVIANLLSHLSRERVRLRVQVPESDLTLPSLYEVYPGTEAMEREVYDLFGVVFTGHPDLTRILMPEDWEGHPLRKDYGVGRIPVQFKAGPGDRPGGAAGPGDRPGGAAGPGDRPGGAAGPGDRPGGAAGPGDRA
ncbi:MAG: NADH-quinone oxidoreductase subunit C [Acidimicrobiales bacterium]